MSIQCIPQLWFFLWFDVCWSNNLNLNAVTVDWNWSCTAFLTAKWVMDIWQISFLFCCRGIVSWVMHRLNVNYWGETTLKNMSCCNMNWECQNVKVVVERLWQRNVSTARPASCQYLPQTTHYSLPLLNRIISGYWKYTVEKSKKKCI